MFKKNIYIILGVGLFIIITGAFLSFNLFKNNKNKNIKTNINYQISKTDNLNNQTNQLQKSDNQLKEQVEDNEINRQKLKQASTNLFNQVKNLKGVRSVKPETSKMAIVVVAQDQYVESLQKEIPPKFEDFPVILNDESGKSLNLSALESSNNDNINKNIPQSDVSNLDYTPRFFGSSSDINDINSQNVTEATKGEIKESEDKSWKVYTNENEGFEFSFPSFLHFEEDIIGLKHILLFTNQAEYPEVLTLNICLKNCTYPSYISNNDFVTAKKISVGNKEAKILEIQNGGVFVYFPQDSQNSYLEFFTGNNNKNREIVDKILSRFVFLK